MNDFPRLHCARFAADRGRGRPVDRFSAARPHECVDYPERVRASGRAARGQGDGRA
jgi:hypothetical protein